MHPLAAWRTAELPLPLPLTQGPRRGLREAAGGDLVGVLGEALGRLDALERLAHQLAARGLVPE